MRHGSRGLAALVVITVGLGVAVGRGDVGAEPPWPTDGVIERHFAVPLTHTDYERLLEQPFDVPAGTRRIEVEYRVTGAEARTVVDLGLRGPAGLRGWSGGAQTRIWVSALGASPGYLPGAIESGRWAVVLGVPNIRPGRADTCAVVVRLYASDLPTGPTLKGRGEGWYVGDLHAHSGHSDGRSRSRRGATVGTPPHRMFDAAAAAGLDFVALTEHNTASHWLDVDRLQAWYDDVLLLHGREITTYRGHATTVGESTFGDFRLPSPATSPVRVLADIAGRGAFVSISHPALPDDERCMGCGWNDTDDVTLATLHGVEIINGDATDQMAGWRFWAAQLSRGHRLVAVGGSDDHTVDNPADRQIGRPTTVVWAPGLSEASIVAGLKSGRVHVRTRGVAGPLLDLHALGVDGGTTFMGGISPVALARLSAEVARANGQTLEWFADGRQIARQVVGADALVLAPPPAARWYAAVLRDADGPTAFSNAIYVADR